MKLSQYNYSFSPDMLAKYPAESRDESRLMVLNRRTGKIEHKVFKEMIDYFRQGDVLVFNDTKVFPARLYGNKEKTGAEIEIFLLRELNRDLRLWDVLVDPARKIRIGNKLYFGDDDLMVAEVIDNTTSRGRTLRFLFDGDYDEFKAALYKLGETPLPKWIRPKVEPIDEERYQTIYAKNEGAVAAPTAGLHFTKELLQRIADKGVTLAYITLHVGLGTFRPVKADEITEHHMHSEFCMLSAETAEVLNRTRQNGGRIICVGTTSCRTLESLAEPDGTFTEKSAWTDIFIYPGYQFRAMDALITNFHLPESTLIMLVSAFAGYDHVMHAYHEAVKSRYRFFSFGDAMLIE